ncbi:hypothetical protein K2173_017099 [Erythroxylum novogranatense]|uniref:Uncharacterized protein n=1 Tax=Erythroxylum novogranatense TaxID=1862640 RepID=A0AAV8U8J7_9ROSI|nr:hypothetical protein K2173_017099 [Erythroxylum novogranatense]
MEIPVINRIGDFEAGINTLQNPSFISQIFTLSSASELIYQASSFWKWGALILAIVASFSTLIARVKVIVVGFKSRFLKASPPLLKILDDDDSDTESETSCSSTSDDEDEAEEEEKEDQPSSSSSRWWSTENYPLKGSRHYQSCINSNPFGLRRRRNGSIGDLFSWAEFPTGESVVKLWDNLGLGLGLNINNESRTFLLGNDRMRGENVSSVFRSPAVVVSGETNISQNLLRVWDTRVGCKIPQMLAEWRPMLGKIVGVNAAELEKIFVSDDVSGGVTVVDGRKLTSPFAQLTESDVETWWDADE